MVIAASVRSAPVEGQAHPVVLGVRAYSGMEATGSWPTPPAPGLVAMPDGHDAESTIRALVAAHEQERRRIARDLHDVIGQALTAVKLNLESLRRETSSRQADAELRRSIAVVDQAMREIRDVAIDLRPAILDDLGLVAAVRWYVSRQGRLVGYRTSFAADPIPLGQDDELESACFRVVQEALTNVARHAQATRVRVELRRTPESIVLTVEDDGVGFDVLRARRRAGRRPTLGLTGMAERASMVGGSLEITSAPGRGTRIRATFARSATPLPMGDR